jgi:hypothetical protein
MMAVRDGQSLTAALEEVDANLRPSYYGPSGFYLPALAQTVTGGRSRQQLLALTIR